MNNSYNFEPIILEKALTKNDKYYSYANTIIPFEYQKQFQIQESFLINDDDKFEILYSQNEDSYYSNSDYGNIYQYFFTMTMFFWIFVFIENIYNNDCINNIINWSTNFFDDEDNCDYEDEDDDEDNCDYEDDDEDKESKEIIKYEDKYKDKLKNIDDIPIMSELLDKLSNSILMETTPLGNVIMFYDNKRETFTYYSDNTIPYRFLETVARKYVILNDCKCIFIDMDEEIEKSEKRIEEKKLQEQITEEEKKENPQIHVNIKKNVFAKLKSYNTNSGLKISGVKGDSNQSTNNKTIVSHNENIILKDKANRYSCEGKISNFSFLKKIDKKVVDKRYALTFAEFKKLESSIKTKSE
jgi:hypothetical protein